MVGNWSRGKKNHWLGGGEKGDEKFYVDGEIPQQWNRKVEDLHWICMVSAEPPFQFIFTVRFASQPQYTNTMAMGIPLIYRFQIGDNVTFSKKIVWRHCLERYKKSMGEKQTIVL